MSVTIEQHQKRLEKLSIAELRLEYENVFGEITTTRHARHIIKRILWQMQASFFTSIFDRPFEVFFMCLQVMFPRDIRAITKPYC